MKNPVMILNEEQLRDCNSCYGWKPNGGFCDGNPAPKEKCYGFTLMPDWVKKEKNEKNNQKGDDHA